MNHLQLIKRIPAARRRQLTRKSDRIGLLHVTGYFMVIALLGTYVALRLPLWYLLMAPLGICLVFCFTLLHETVHKTVFKTGWPNRLVAAICGFLILIPPTWFQHFHFAHHRYTQIAGKDPELDTPKPATRAQLWLHLSGIPLWRSQICTLFAVAAGRIHRYVPAPAARGVVREARMQLFAYAALLVISVWAQATALLYLWIIPMLIGQPFLRFYLLAEHLFCDHSDNMLANTRTVKTHWLIRKLAWNMPYHVEHHSLPGVPFYKLPELHAVLQPHARVIESGYLDFARLLLQRIPPRAMPSAITD